MTETEELYLITIAGLAERRGQLLVSLSDLAEGLRVLPASVHQMIHKLEGRGTVAYPP